MKRFVLLFFLCLSLFVISASADEEEVPAFDDGFTLERIIPIDEYSSLDTDAPLDSIEFAAVYSSDSSVSPRASWSFTFSSVSSYKSFSDVANYAVVFYNGYFYYCAQLPATAAEIVATKTPGAYTFYRVNTASSTDISPFADYIQAVASSGGGSFTLADLQSWGGTSLSSALSTISSLLTTNNSTLSTISSRVNTTNTRLTTTNNYLNTANVHLQTMKEDIEDYFKISSADLLGSAGASSGFLLQSTGEFMAAASLGTSGEWDIGRISANGFAGLGRILSTFSAHFDEYREDFSDYQQDFSGYRDEFNTVFPLYSGSLTNFNNGSLSSHSVTNSSVPALMADMHNDLITGLTSTSFLNRNGTDGSNSSYNIATVTGYGFQGLASLIRGSSGSKYPFTFVSAADGMSTYSVTPGSLMESLQFGFQGIQNPLAKLQYVYADEIDIEMKKDSEENSAAITDNFIKPGSAGSVSVKDISDMASVSSAVSGLTSTGVSLGDGFGQIVDADVWSFFTQDVASSLDTVPVVVSEDSPQYTDAYGANMAEFYSRLGLGNYEYSTAVENEVDAIWAEIMGGGD